MATTKFSIADNAVNQHGSNLGQAVSSFDANLTHFQNSISNLEGNWQGASYSSWTELTNAFKEAHTNLDKQLQIIQERVSSAGQIYDQGLAEQASGIAKVNQSANWSGANAKL